MSASTLTGLYALCGSLVGLSTTALALRLHGRRRQHLKLEADDWTALLGVVTYVSACACIIATAQLGGTGYHPKGVTQADREKNFKTTVQLQLAYDWLNTTTMACAKISALFLYRRIFYVAGHNNFNKVVLATIVVVICWSITFDVLSLLQCRSYFSAFWVPGEYVEYCDLDLVWAFGLAYSDLILDLWVLLLPMPRVWHLHVSTKKKLAILGVFCLGYTGLGASIARIIVFEVKASPGRETAFIGSLESGMTILAVNLPSLWYVISRITILHKVSSSLRSLLTRSEGSRSAKELNKNGFEICENDKDGLTSSSPAIRPVPEKFTRSDSAPDLEANFRHHTMSVSSEHVDEGDLNQRPGGIRVCHDVEVKSQD